MNKEQLKNIILTLKACSEMDCKKCPRFIDEQEDGVNYYMSICNLGMMAQVAYELNCELENMDEDIPMEYFESGGK